MRRILFTSILTLTFSAFGTAAVAQESDATIQTEFYQMGGSVVDGRIKQPTGSLYLSLNPAIFERYIRLKKSFLPNIEATGKDKALQ